VVTLKDVKGARARGRGEEAVVIGVEAMHSSEGRFWQSDDIDLLHR
jgi:hypothetical protein